MLLATLRNRLVMQRRRLRKPRYLIGLLIGLGYFALLLLSDDPDGTQAARGETWRMLLPMLMALYLLSAWILGRHREMLGFTPAETQFLFTAPISRRALLHYRLVRPQLALVFSAVLLTVLARPTGLPWWLRFPTYWLLLTTFQLHQLVAALVHVSTSAGAGGLRRNLVPLLLVIPMFGGLVWSVLAAFQQLEGVRSVSEITERLNDVLQGPLSTLVLIPFRMLVGPLLASDGAEWVRAAGPAALLLVLHYFWVVRTDRAFEEAAADAELRTARRIEAKRGDRRPAVAGRRALFPLVARGMPATALVWKNLIAFVRSFRRSTLVLIVVVLSLVAVNLYRSAETSERLLLRLGTVALGFAVMTVVLGPLGLRNDLRQDLAHMSLLRTYPIRGHAIVAAEVGSAVIILTVMQLGLLGIAGAAFSTAGALGTGPAVILACASLATLPAFNGLGLAIQNGLALFFPDWMRVGVEGSSGVEFLGQAIVRLAASVVLLGIGLLLPAIVGAAIGFRSLVVLGPWAGLAGALTAVAALWFEVGLIVAWLGGVFERTDPSEAGLPS